nr:MAG TPA: hypothetical protein [Bacteriophage sp.]
MALCVFSFQVRLESLRYASDSKNSKKSVRPYVTCFEFHFPPYGLRFGRFTSSQYF